MPHRLNVVYISGSPSAALTADGLPSQNGVSQLTPPARPLPTAGVSVSVDISVPHGSSRRGFIVVSFLRVYFTLDSIFQPGVLVREKTQRGLQFREQRPPSFR